MSYSQDGGYMGQSPRQAGSVRRARELAAARAAAGGNRGPSSSVPVPPIPRQVERPVQRSMERMEQPMARAMGPQPAIAQPQARRVVQMPPAATTSRIPMPRQQGPALQDKRGQIAVPISRPTQVPQWPLAGPLASPPGASSSDGYRPPAGRSQPPPRPQRPSRVPSMLDGSKIQEPTPSFQYQPQQGRDSAQDMSSVPNTPASAQSRPTTQSSTGSIPDFPMPSYGQGPATLAPPRRSVGLGPPPSSRRGASSFYSNASYVSPIPEESPRTRSNASYASSAAMPIAYADQSPMMSPRGADDLYDDVIPEESGQIPFDEDGDERQLVRSASVGKRARPLLVNTGSTSRAPNFDDQQMTSPNNTVTSFLGDASSSSSGTAPTVKTPTGGALTADNILNAYNAASAADPNRPPPSPQPPSRPYSRLSAIRRPPKLDIDSVRKAEARGSLTSLPDLIRRATQLAASLERGKRPASRFDSLEDFAASADPEKEEHPDLEKHPSGGLSDMLAAFPPPAAANRDNRQSGRQQVGVSWPMPTSFFRGASSTTPGDVSPPTQLPARPPARKRRYCGLPLWGFLTVLLVVLILIAVAVVIPLEFFVFHKLNPPNSSAQPDLSGCQSQINCANGGTAVFSSGVCACICTNGFTGPTCTGQVSTACTSTSFPGSDNLSNVTIGDAFPRLIEQAQTNFSIPLNATAILSKVNSGNLSCIAQNALITFDGEATRVADANALVTDSAGNSNVIAAAAPTVLVLDGVLVTTITIMAGQGTTFTLFPTPTPAPTPAPTTGTNGAANAPPETSVPQNPLQSSFFQTPTRTTTITTTVTTITPVASPSTTSTTFSVTEQVLDFARAAVLFVLQEEDLNSAEIAQGDLQQFFTSASQHASNSTVTLDQARNVTIGHGNSVDLIRFVVDTGAASAGGKGGS